MILHLDFCIEWLNPKFKINSNSLEIKLKMAQKRKKREFEIKEFKKGRKNYFWKTY